MARHFTRVEGPARFFRILQDSLLYPFCFKKVG